jgi:hypothetical protein
MENGTVSELKEFSGWGFRISISPSELIAVRDNRTYDLKTKRKRWTILFFFLVFSFASYIGEFLRIGLSHQISITWMFPEILNSQSFVARSMTWTILLFSPVWPLVVVWEVLYPRRANLRCTEEVIEVTRTVRGVIRSIYSFRKENVKRIYFDSGYLPWQGHLAFSVNNRQIKCLTGIKCMEAQQILDALAHMGFDVVRASGPGLTNPK